jgi:hypothetical protein
VSRRRAGARPPGRRGAMSPGQGRGGEVAVPPGRDAARTHGQERKKGRVGSTCGGEGRGGGGEEREGEGAHLGVQNPAITVSKT